MSNLIERGNKILENFFSDDCVAAEYIDEWSLTGQFIHEAIEALSPVLPDDVAEMVEILQTPYGIAEIPTLTKAADLLERLQSRIDELKASNRQWAESTAAIHESTKARIEELEANEEALHGLMGAKDKRIADLQARERDLEFSLNTQLVAEDEIKRLNAVLDRLVGKCTDDSFSSRVCERGTKCCDVYHIEYARNRGIDETHYDEHDKFTGRP